MEKSNLCKYNLFYGRESRAGFFVVFAWVLFFLLVSTNAFAHRVVVFAWIEGNMVYTQSKFSGGVRVSKGEITVYDESGQVLVTGVTDDHGDFSFLLPALETPSELKIVLNAGMGHQGHWILKRDEISRAMDMEMDQDVSAVGAEPAEAIVQPVPSSTPAATTQNDTPCRMDDAELRQIVEEAVDRKLSPVMDMLVAIHEESAIGLDDVMAGLGYIFGLTGVLAWFYSRKKG